MCCVSGQWRWRIVCSARNVWRFWCWHIGRHLRETVWSTADPVHCMLSCRSSVKCYGCPSAEFLSSRSIFYLIPLKCVMNKWVKTWPCMLVNIWTPYACGKFYFKMPIKNSLKIQGGWYFCDSPCGDRYSWYHQPRWMFSNEGCIAALCLSHAWMSSLSENIKNRYIIYFMKEIFFTTYFCYSRFIVAK